ncbi:MAG: VWA domain-containing protein [Fibrobacterota bacterium]|nr:MAG: VWA domain-containing protein [Fibrobacterota bacterium]
MKKIGILVAASLLLAGCEVSTMGGGLGSDSTKVTLGDESIIGKTGKSDYKTVANTPTKVAGSTEGSTTTTTDCGCGTTGTQTSTAPTKVAGQITAGEWNDLANWGFWTTLNTNADFSQYATYWSYNLNNRISVHVTQQGTAQVDAQVELLNSDGRVLWTARTDNKGNAELWPTVVGDGQSSTTGLRARIGTQIFESIKVNGQGGTNNLAIETGSGIPSAIDVGFMVDATGSMDDELDYLKEELKDVIDQARIKNGNAVINTGAVFYRDRGDAYVTDVSDFTSSNSTTASFVAAHSAGGGGDYPEAVHTALDVSLSSLKWSSSAKARILFIVLDAPPHYEQSIVSKLHELVRAASAKGVRIIPIACSGVDKDTEFLLRYMAIATGGTYVFVTDDSGIGGTHLVASVGDYRVEYLNALMVRLIGERIK